MKLSQCRAFVLVAESGTFTAAAKQIGVSQSAISHAISALEKELGTELLNRQYGRITLTNAGLRILESARLILNHAEEIVSVSSRMSSAALPRLRIGVSRSFGKRVLPRFLTELGSYRSDILLDVRVGPCSLVEEWVKDSHVDIGIATLPSSGLPAGPLVRDRMHVVLSPSHPLNASPTVHVRQLANEALIMSGGESESEQCAFLEEHGVTPHIGIRVNDLPTLLSLVANGYGATLLPSLAVPAKLPQLRSLPLVPEMPHDQVFALSKMGTDHPHANEFVSLVKNWVKFHLKSITLEGSLPSCG